MEIWLYLQVETNRVQRYRLIMKTDGKRSAYLKAIPDPRAVAFEEEDLGSVRMH